MEPDEQPASRSMDSGDWARVQIQRGKYFNKEGAIHGFSRADGQSGNALHPADVFEDQLQQTFAGVQESHADITLARYHVRMPYWSQETGHLPTNYAFVADAERLATTSVTVVLVPRDRVVTAEMGFYMDGKSLRPLRERMKGTHFRGFAGNLGYRMTENLITDTHPWSHGLRYPDCLLPTFLSYLGFYYFRDEATEEVYSSFQGAHPAAVGICGDGTVEILPHLEITKYAVTLWGETFTVESINSTNSSEEVILFTPGLWTSEVAGHVDQWANYAPEIPIPDRVNIFIANEGDGSRPVEKVVQIWRGRAPLPSFGAVLSFSERRFEQLMAAAGTAGELALGKRVQVEPVAGADLSRYRQILGGFVPAVVGGRHLYCVPTEEQVRQNLKRFGNATSPIAECGRESRNFDLRIREPAGLFLQTTDGRIGWVLFDGRHELSIGANVVDVAQILKILEGMGIFEVEHALFVDGGSAMKAYAIDSDSAVVRLDLLNRVAAGSRNGPGSDPDGLNLYTLLRLGIAA